ncbi:MAG: hypothetical protein AAGA56_14855 [Myxococcota bacterium]
MAPLEGAPRPPVTVVAKPVTEWQVERSDERGPTFVAARVCTERKGPSFYGIYRTWTADGLGVAKVEEQWVRPDDDDACFRVTVANSGQPKLLAGVILAPYHRRGLRVTFSIPLQEPGHDEKGARAAHLLNLKDYYEKMKTGGSAFARFAERRLSSLHKKAAPQVYKSRRRRAAPSSVDDDTDFFSERERDRPSPRRWRMAPPAVDADLVGLDSVYAAIGVGGDDDYGTSSDAQRTLPLGEYVGGLPFPEEPAIDYEAMLKKERPAPNLVWADMVPADHYLFAIPRTERMEVVVDLGQRVLSAGQGVSVLKPWLCMAGLDLTALREMDGRVASRMAITGSDLFVDVGSDLTLVAKEAALGALDPVLERTRRRLATEVGEIRSEPVTVAGVNAVRWRSADGRVQQLVARIDGFTYVSSAAEALRDHLAVRRGKAPPLQAEADVRWLATQLDPVDAEVFFVLGRSFVQRTTGQAVRTLHMRRRALLFELRRLGYSELLFRQIHGRAPADVKELVKAGYLLSRELKHHDGEPITWQPGQRAQSVYGTPERLVRVARPRTSPSTRRVRRPQRPLS